MENRDLKKLLMSSLQREEQLCQLVEECLDLIFETKEDAQRAKYHFNEDIEHGFDWNGCLQSIETMKKNMEFPRKEDHKQKEKGM